MIKEQLLFTALASTLLTLIPFSQVHAKEIISKVEKLGCHIDSGACYVYVNQKIDSQCAPHNDGAFRWLGKRHRHILDILLKAQQNNEAVKFYSTDECWNGAPVFSRIEINGKHK